MIVDNGDNNMKDINEVNPYHAKVLENTRITATTHFQDVRHFAMESNLKYEPGDVCAIQPKNISSVVNRYANPYYLNILISTRSIITRFNLDPNQTFHIERLDADAPSFPSSKMTWYELFESYLDIAGTPRRYFFELLAKLNEDEDEKDRLQWFGSADGVEDLYRYNQREKRMYVEVLEGNS